MYGQNALLYIQNYQTIYAENHLYETYETLYLILYIGYKVLYCQVFESYR